jgi:hypothetical protein
LYGRTYRLLWHLDEWGAEKVIGQIVSAIGGLATSYIDGKTAVQKANAEIKLKQATGEIDWEQSAIEASKDSWKDELWTIVFVLILAANFIPSMQDVMAAGFANLEECPLWVQWGMYASIAASFGIRTVKGFGKGK